MKRVVLCIGLSLGIGSAAFALEPLKSRTKKPAARDTPGYDAVSPRYPHAINRHESSPDSKHPTSINSAAIDLNPVPATGRKRWEAMLAQPADLDFGERQTVTAKELLDQLRERHRLSLRLDIPTFAALVGAERVIGVGPVVKQPKIKKSAIPPMAKVNSRIQLTGGTYQPGVPLVVELQRDEIAQPMSEPEDSSSTPGDGASDADDSAQETKKNKEDHEDEDEAEANIIDQWLSLQVNIQTLDLQQASIATVLRQTLDAMPIVFGADFMETPFPISLTNACLLDYLVEDDGLLITTRMQALSHKETRVYSIKQFKDLNPEQLAKILRQSVRPWSWRSQINDLGDQLRGSLQVSPEMVKSLVTSGVQLAAAQAGATVTISEDELPKAQEKSGKSDAEQLAAVGNAAVNGLVTFAQATVLGVEMIHRAEFPTGTIFTLPGKLIVTQSQAAHREIADLLTQLAEE